MEEADCSIVLETRNILNSEDILMLQDIKETCPQAQPSRDVANPAMLSPNCDRHNNMATMSRQVQKAP